MARTKGKKPGGARRKAEREAKAIASSAAEKSAVLKDDIKSNSSNTNDNLAISASSAIAKPAVPKHDTESTSSSSTKKSAVSNVVKQPATSDNTTTSRIAAQDISIDNGSLSVFSAEEMLMIFSKLEYSHLKVCTMVSKSFIVLLEHPCFDKTLFRRGTPLENCKGITPVESELYGRKIKNWVEIHPGFGRLWYSCTSKPEHKVIPDFSEALPVREPVPLIATSAASEYVTMPALKRLKIKLTHYGTVHFKNEKGMTVGDVVKTVVGYFGTELPDGTMLSEVYGAFDSDDEDVSEDRPATYGDAQGDHNAWHGIRGHTVSEDGTLTLLADGYDS